MKRISKGERVSFTTNTGRTATGTVVDLITERRQPTMVLIDKQGRVVSYSLHGGELDAELRKLLSTTRPASTK